MHPYPHRYSAAASARPDGAVPTDSPSLPTLSVAPPPEFDGPGGHWSPETLLLASLADCFVLTFRAIAAASKFPYTSVAARVEGTLEKAAGVAQFTKFETHASLVVPAGTDRAKAQLLLERAEHHCLIANSVKGSRALTTEIAEG